MQIFLTIAVVKVKARNDLLRASIGALPYEEEAYTKFITMISVTVVLLVFLTTMAAVLFKLLNGKFHPFACIIIPSNQESPEEESHSDEGLQETDTY